MKLSSLQSNSEKLDAMREGGKKLAFVRDSVIEKIKPGVTFEQLEELAQKLIKEQGATPSFSTVEGYSWATCININEGCCHGVPVNGVVSLGDYVTLDVGLVYDGYHTDTSVTVVAGDPSKAQRGFLNAGKESLLMALQSAKHGASVYEVSDAMAKGVLKYGFQPVYQLVGHGIGKQLHEKPSIPCLPQHADKKIVLEKGQTVAIEIMYAQGNAQLQLAKDGWTYETVDGSNTGMFEHTVIITEDFPEVLTLPNRDLLKSKNQKGKILEIADLF